MLLECSIDNFLSIKQRVTLSLEAAAISEFPENTFTAGNYTLLRSAVIYGANSSGKSNLLRAISFMRHLVLSSARLSSTDGLGVTPFLLSTETRKAPSRFEVLFLLGGHRYRYGFEVSEQRVHTEWLFRAKAKAEKCLFVRDGEAIQLEKGFEEGKGLEEKTRDNALFLSVVDQFNGPLAKAIMGWFRDMETLSGLAHELYRLRTFHLLNQASARPLLHVFLDKLDLGFDEVQTSKRPFDPAGLPADMPSELRDLVEQLANSAQLDFRTRHAVFDASQRLVDYQYFDLDKQESSGTNKIFDLLGPIFETLTKGTVLVVDELNAKLHPLLTKALVDLFHSTETNPRQAQLIFATHDTNLLTYGHFRRDQIYFTEKDKWGATDLYALIEYKEGGETIRKDRSFEKDYIQGRYGAIPYLGNLSELMSQWQEKQKSITPS
ncbi:MAG: ATP-binding protein [Bacteroidia bacterium]|nr:ATP-binding protein [Bacteroidia bacterium]